MTSVNDMDANYMSYALPKEYSSSEMFIQDEKFDPCHMYQKSSETQDGLCLEASFDNATVLPCDKFVYDTSLFTETLTTKLDLVR